MTITVYIDGWPYEILFSGAIDISRMAGSDDIAIRRASDDCRIWGIDTDAKDVDRRLWKSTDKTIVRSLAERYYLEALHGARNIYWHGLDPFVFVRFNEPYPWESSTGGSKVRGGYD